MADTIDGYLAIFDRELAQGHAHAAQTALLDALVGRPESDWLESARALVLRNDGETARHVLASAVATYTDSIDLRFALAGMLQESRQFSQAEVLLRDLLAQHPAHAAGTFLLAHLLTQQGRMHAAACAVRALFQHGSHDIADVIQGVELLDSCGRQHDAAAICAGEIAAGSADLRLYAYAGMLEVQLGAFERARQHYEFLLQNNAQSLEWSVPIGLSSAQRYRNASHPDFQLFRNALQRTDLSDKTRSATLFALGKAHDDTGDYAQASSYLRQANLMVHATTPWSRKRWRRIISGHLVSEPPALQLTPPSDWTPVFIVGVPRSGTTLVAELLSRHPDVCNRGELAWLSSIARSVSTVDGRHTAVFEQAAAKYGAQLRQDDSDAHWFVDKQPLNLLHVDLILALWPNARIIHCMRNPRDTALSLWSQSFIDDAQGYACDFTDIAVVIKDCARLMAHWKKRYAASIYSVNYEQLTGSPDTVISALAGWLDLPQCDLLGAASAANAISSASLWQARQPVYTSSVGRWRHYAAYAPELLQLPAH